MAVNVNADLCSACGSCVDECPVEALALEDVVVVDADTCVDCGACTSACPMDALEL